ncbi:hypothetical protein EK21DRAFT_92658 [Setomelanomma holmii]|uniref:Uncharacterized protein n=1 Tax=Setomelanomma holmii TaxID=210430 RepID=A0A9P4H1X7_9PLEO|nr:hypothetical protein EK21DRAFT_92658 [Setomelanomma holmii]
MLFADCKRRSSGQPQMTLYSPGELLKAHFPHIAAFSQAHRRSLSNLLKSARISIRSLRARTSDSVSKFLLEPMLRRDETTSFTLPSSARCLIVNADRFHTESVTFDASKTTIHVPNSPQIPQLFLSRIMHGLHISSVLRVYDVRPRSCLNKWHDFIAIPEPHDSDPEELKISADSEYFVAMLRLQLYDAYVDRDRNLDLVLGFSRLSGEYWCKFLTQSTAAMLDLDAPSELWRDALRHLGGFDFCKRKKKDTVSLYEDHSDFVDVQLTSCLYKGHVSIMVDVNRWH